LEPVAPVDVSAVLTDLDADDPAVRKTASKKLLAIGPAATAGLMETVKTGSPEASARAAILLVDIRTQFKSAYVRRLMAIRALAELKDRKSLPILRPLLQSREMFEAEYARQAMATIEGSPWSPPTATESERAADVALLPARLDVIVQLAPSINTGFTFENLLNLLPFEKAQKDQARDEVQPHLFEALQAIGSARIDAITVGMYSAPPSVPGNYMVIFRGQFDAAAIRAALGKLTPRSDVVNGTHVFLSR